MFTDELLAIAALFINCQPAVYLCTRDRVLSSLGRVPPNIHKGCLLCGMKDKGAAKRDENLVGKHVLGVF